MRSILFQQTQRTNPVTYPEDRHKPPPPCPVLLLNIDRTVFAYDPSYKPPHATVDKWYMTEAGPKASLMVRVKESRWQSCHSRQTGRLRKKTTWQKVQPQPEKPTPGPTHYHLRDPWEIKVRG